MAVDTLISNCRVVAPQGSFAGGVAIEGEKIVALVQDVTVGPEVLHTRSDFSPWDGREFTGWPRLTMLQGTIVAEEGAIRAAAGIGRYQPAHVKP